MNKFFFCFVLFYFLIIIKERKIKKKKLKFDKYEKLKNFIKNNFHLYMNIFNIMLCLAFK